MTNLTHPGSTSILYVGDVSQFVFQGGINLAVIATWKHNGTPGQAVVGSIQSNGSLALQGTQTTASIGTWFESFTIGSANATPTFSWTTYALPTVTMSNVTRPGNPNFYVGDESQFVFTGPPNQPIVASWTHNGTPGSATVGSTPSGGTVTVSVTLNGTETAASVGSWTESFTVGGIAVGSFSWNVYALPTVQISNLTHPGDPNFYTNDHLQLLITGPAGQTVTASESLNGGTPTNVTLGQIPTGGTLTYTAAQSSIGNWVWSVSVGAVPAGTSLTFAVVVPKPATISGPSGATSATFWYLGGNPSIDGYAVTTTLTATAPNPSDPAAQILWTTDSPSKVSISANGLTAVLTSTGASGFNAGFDIHVTVNYDGIPSAAFPVMIRTPYSMTTSTPGQYCAGGLCGCPSQYPSDWVGFANFVSHGIADQMGKTLGPITTHESLEKAEWLNASYSVFPNPEEGTWTTNIWTGNAFPDVFALCAAPAAATALDPPLASYNPSGTAAVFNETQKFWVGSSTDFQGVCVQRGVVTFYTDHGAISSYSTPITNTADCSRGVVLN